MSKHKSVSARRAAKTAKADANALAKGNLPKGKMVTPEEVAAIKRLNDIGKEIEVKLVKADKANDMLVSVNQLLVEAEALCTKHGGKVMSFSIFKEKFCPSLGRSAAYEVRAILLGKKTRQQLADANKNRQQKHRDKAKENPLRNGQPPDGITRTLLGDGTITERSAVDFRKEVEDSKKALGADEPVDKLGERIDFDNDNDRPEGGDGTGGEQPYVEGLSEQQDASWFYDLTAEAAAKRACYALVVRGLQPHHMFGIFCETLSQMMNEGTWADAIKRYATKKTRADAVAEQEKRAA